MKKILHFLLFLMATFRTKNVRRCIDISSTNFPNLLYIGEKWQYIEVSKTWEDSGDVTYQMGAVGYIFSGGTNYDARSSPQGESAIFNEGASLDPYFGHSDPGSQYHYHAVSFF